MDQFFYYSSLFVMFGFLCLFIARENISAKRTGVNKSVSQNAAGSGRKELIELTPQQIFHILLGVISLTTAVVWSYFECVKVTTPQTATRVGGGQVWAARNEAELLRQAYLRGDKTAVQQHAVEMMRHAEGSGDQAFCSKVRKVYGDVETEYGESIPRGY